MLALEYTGAHTVHDYSIENLNQQGMGVVYLGTDLEAPDCQVGLGRCDLDRLNRQYGNMKTRGFGGYSHYHIEHSLPVEQFVQSRPRSGGELYLVA